MTIVYALVTGFIFGILLQQGRVIRYDKQVGLLRLKDFTIIKFMFSAVLIGMIGIYLLLGAGLIELSVKATVLGMVIIGGLIFGIGWALLGYCPGTQLGALGEGRWDAIWGVIGMLIGGMIFAEVYTPLKNSVGTWGDFGKITLPAVLGISPWIVIVILVILGLLLFWWLEKRGL